MKCCGKLASGEDCPNDLHEQSPVYASIKLANAQLVTIRFVIEHQPATGFGFRAINMGTSRLPSTMHLFKAGTQPVLGGTMAQFNIESLNVIAGVEKRTIEIYCNMCKTTCSYTTL